MYHFENKVVVITGGAHGIGKTMREETPPPGQRGQAAAGPCHPVQRGAVPGPGGAEPAGDHPGGAGPAGG